MQPPLKPPSRLPLDTQNGLNEYAGTVIRHKARELVGRYGFTRDDYEDLTQEIALDLLMRLSKFDHTKASLNTFIARIVNRKISNLIRHRTQEMRDYRSEACSLDEPIDEEDTAGSQRGYTLSQDEFDQRTSRHSRPESERIDMRLDVSFVLSTLPSDLKAFAERLLHQSIAEAARDLGVPRTTLYDTGIARLRRAFEDKGLRKYL